LPNSTEVGFSEKDWPGTNGTVTPQHGGDGRDGAVEEEHAARQNPRTSAGKGRNMIVPFCDRHEDRESILGLALTLKVDSTPATLSQLVTTRGLPPFGVEVQRRPD
jgi:hypothetical protein